MKRAGASTSKAGGRAGGRKTALTEEANRDITPPTTTKRTAGKRKQEKEPLIVDSDDGADDLEGSFDTRFRAPRKRQASPDENQQTTAAPRTRRLGNTRAVVQSPAKPKEAEPPAKKPRGAAKKAEARAPAAAQKKPKVVVLSSDEEEQAAPPKQKKRAVVEDEEEEAENPEVAGSSTRKRKAAEPSPAPIDEVAFLNKFGKKSPVKKKPKKAPVTLKDDAEEKTSKKKAAEPKEKRPTPVQPSAPKLPALNLLQTEKLDQWVDRHRPQAMKDLIGLQTPQAAPNKLHRWLKDWPRNHLGSTSKLKKPKATVGAGANDGSEFRAALLSGPPGIGKTTTAQLVCRDLGLHFVELNASDARSKKLMDAKVGGLLDNRDIETFFGEKSAKPDVVDKKGNRVTNVLIMDEVDGMSGNQDRAGIAELILMIKKSKVPIICICNDRQSQKMRSLVNHCFDLRFTKPNVQQVTARMMTILVREKVKIPKEVVEKVVLSANMDLRQSIYALQLLAASQDKSGDVFEKDVAVNTFEAARLLLSQKTTMLQKRDLFFMDYSIMPLFVQEMYLNVRSSTWGKRAQLRAQAQAAESIALGDVVGHQVRHAQNWSLLPLQGMMSCVLPTAYLNGHLTAQINFPQWLGKYSNERKRRRLLQEFAAHAGDKMSGPLDSICLDYMPLLRQRICRPLLEKEPDIDGVVGLYREYHLIRDDFETINELGTWNEKDDLWKRVDARTKAALTRNLNHNPFKLPFAVEDGVQVISRTTTKAGGKGRAKKEQLAAEKPPPPEDVDEDAAVEAAENEAAEKEAEILAAM